jgi:hypothetical protein
MIIPPPEIYETAILHFIDFSIVSDKQSLLRKINIKINKLPPNEARADSDVSICEVGQEVRAG